MKANLNRVRSLLDNAKDNVANPFTNNGPAPDSKSTVDASADLDHQSMCESQFDQRLADILDGYLQAIEDGTPLEAETLISRHPEYAEHLREYLSGLNLLNAGFAEFALTGTPLESAPETERGRLGDYELVREVGRGGMGVVYEAHQISLDRRVALKVLPFAAMLDSRQITRFENEARAAAQLHHPHIVPVYGVGCDRGVHYFAMQFINGQSIRELIDSCALEFGDLSRPAFEKQSLSKSNSHDKPASEGVLRKVGALQKVSPREVARLGLQAASALHAAHQCGIVHRDIKPSNLMLDAYAELWVTDFGLARFQADNKLTKSGDMIGTLHYMSPEQARGDSAIADPRTDIYSLGVTLHEMLTLRRPFEGATHGEVLQQIELGACKPVRHWNAAVPRDLANVIAKAMAVEPADRYQTAVELAEDLRRFVDGEATHAKLPSKAQLLTRWATRNRGIVVSSMTALFVMCLTLTASTFWLASERAMLATKHEQANRKLATTESTFEQFGLVTAERLKQIPGSESARQALLGDLLEHYQSLLKESAELPTLREDRAVTNTKIASLYRESGALQQAVDAYRAAAADFEFLLESSPRNRDYRSQLAKCLSSVSIVLSELGEIDEAREEVQAAIRLQRQLVEEDADVGARIALATSFANLGCIEGDRNMEAAVGHFQRAAILAEQARSAASDDGLVEALCGLASIHGNLSSLLQSANPAVAMAHAEQAVACTRSLVQTRPDPHTGFHSLHATNCNNLATLYAQQGQQSSAIGLYEEAATQAEQTGDRETLIVTLCNLAKTQYGLTESQDAINTYSKAIAIQSALLLDSPANLNYVSRLGGLQNNLAFAWHGLGRLENASVAYEAAIEYQHRAFELAPKHLATYRDALSRTFFNASRVWLDAGRPCQAADLQRRRGELWPNNAAQLFSVATSIANATQRMPNHDPRRNEWRRIAASTLRDALSLDTSHLIDSGKITKLARFLADEPNAGNG